VTALIPQLSWTVYDALVNVGFEGVEKVRIELVPAGAVTGVITAFIAELLIFIQVQEPKVAPDGSDTEQEMPP
jgi:hypothetical protein